MALDLLAEMIMEKKAKAERAITEKEYTQLIEEYAALRKRWEEVAGKAAIGFEIKRAG